MTFIAHLRTSCRFARRLALVVLSVSLSACGSSSTPGGSGTAMTDTNNYKATSAMNIPVIPTKAMTDLTIDWSGLKKDLLCHDLKDPIVSATLAVFPNKKAADLEAELSVGIFNTAEVHPYFILDTDGTVKSTMLSALKNQKTPLNPSTDFVESSNSLYLLVVATSQTPGVGAVSMAFLQPSSSSNVTTVMAPDPCDNHVLSFMATLGTPLDIPKTAPYTIDWSQLSHDGFDNPIDFTTIQKVEVAYYQNMTAQNLMDDFLNVEVNATTLYSASVSGGKKSLDLATTKTTGGDAFPGFNQSGTYAMALLCNNCTVPAPVGFTILQPK
jgi:hypothetical protein